MSELKYCRNCKRMFPYVVGPVLCKECINKEEDDFKKVREHLRQYPGQTLLEVAKLTEVSAKKIQNYLREGRLELTSDSEISIYCERCDKPIKTGRFCPECTKSVSNEMQKLGKDLLNKSSQVENKKTGEGFRYLHKDK